MKELIFNHFKRLQKAKGLQEMFPELNQKDGKIHVLFVQCLISREGVYRTYLPYLILNKSDSHTAIIANLQKRDFNMSFQDYDLPLHYELIEWADLMIFPTLLSPAKQIFQSVKKINPSIRFVMDIDRNYFGQKEISRYEQYSIAQKQQLLENIMETDMLTLSSASLNESYQRLFKKEGIKNTFHRAVIPNFLNVADGQGLEGQKVQNQHQLRIGFFEEADSNDYSEELEQIDAPLKAVYYGSFKDKKERKSKLGREYHKTVPFLNYLTKIKTLGLDLVLLDIDIAGGSLHHAVIRFAELALLEVPVICSVNSPIAKYIQDGKNGFLLDENTSIRKKLTEVISRRQQLPKIGRMAREVAIKYLSWNPDRAIRLAHIYA